MTRTITLALIGGLALAGCGDKMAASTPKPALTPFVAGPTAAITLPCTGTPSPEVLTLRLDRNMLRDLARPALQQITRNVKRGTTVMRDPPALYDKSLYATNLDLAANRKAVSNGDYVIIQVILDSNGMGNRDLIFLRPNASTTPVTGDSGLAAILVRGKDAAQFCGLSTITRDLAAQTETVSFGTLLPPPNPTEPASQAKSESSINIGIQIANLRNGNFSTPIYIDPNVRNEG